jgi:hypothetical protein
MNEMSFFRLKMYSLDSSLKSYCLVYEIIFLKIYETRRDQLAEPVDSLVGNDKHRFLTFQLHNDWL